MNRQVIFSCAFVACCLASFMIGRTASLPIQEVRQGPHWADGSFEPHDRLPKGFAGQRASRSSGLRSVGQSKTASLKPAPHATSTLGATDLDQMEAIFRSPAPLDCAQNWLDFVTRLDSTECQAVASEFQRRGTVDQRGQEYLMLLDAWTRVDPQAALKHAQESKDFNREIETVLTTWSAQDPDSAMQWFDTIRQGEHDSRWIFDIVNGMGASDLQRATELACSLPRWHAKRAVTYLADDYIKLGNEAAYKWALSIENKHLRSAAKDGILRILSASDAQGCAELMLSYPSDDGRAHSEQIIESMVKNDPQATVEYMSKLGDLEEKRHIMHAVIMHLSNSNPRAATNILDSHPALVSDEMLYQMVQNAWDKDPEFSAREAHRIQDPEKRIHAYKVALTYWVRKDSESALNWVKQNELPESVRRAIDSESQRMQEAER